MKSVREFTWLYAKWLWDPGKVLVGVLVAIVPPLLIPLRWPHSVDPFRVWSVVVQIVGLSFVLNDIRERLSLAGYSFANWRQAWLAQKPTRVEHHVLQAASGMMGGSAGSAQVKVSVAGRSPPSVEQRVEQLEKDLVELKAEVVTRTDDLGRKISTVSDRVKEERKQREAEHKVLADAISQLKTHSIGSFRGDIVGVAWVFIGIVLGGLPDRMLLGFADAIHTPMLQPTIELPLVR